MEPADKPGSVVSSHSSRACVTTNLKQPTRGPHGPCVGFLQAPLFGLALGGVYLATPVTSCAVRSYRTLSPLPKLIWAVYFLLHFPWTHILQELPGTLPVEPGLSSAPLILSICPFIYQQSA